MKNFWETIWAERYPVARKGFTYNAVPSLSAIIRHDGNVTNCITDRDDWIVVAIFKNKWVRLRKPIPLPEFEAFADR